MAGQNRPNEPFSGRCWPSSANPNARIEPCSDQLLQEGIDLYDQRPDKDWSLTDCISFVVMRKQSITEALTGDHHFEQAGFVALLK